MRDSTVWDFKVWPLATLTGDRINGFFYKEMCGRNNKVTHILEVVVSRGSSFLSFHSFIHFFHSFISFRQSGQPLVLKRSQWVTNV